MQDNEMQTKGKTLVMGASGFLGSHVVKALAAQGRDIRIFTRETSDTSTIKHLEFEQVYGDVSDKESIKKAIDGCSTLFYCIVDARAWLQDITPLIKTNIDGFRNVIEAALEANIQKFVFTSTIVTIGLNPSGIASEKDEYNWGSDAPDYMNVRRDAENMFLKYCKEDGLPGVACNVSMTYGAEDKQPTPHGWLIALLGFGMFPWYWKTKFSSVGIQDAANAMVLAAEHGRNGERYIITDKTLTMEEIIRLSRKHLGLTDSLFKLPIPILWSICWVAEKLAAILKKESRYNVQALECSFKMNDFDNSKAINELKWTPRPVEESIKECAEWLFERRDNPELAARLFEK